LIWNIVIPAGMAMVLLGLVALVREGGYGLKKNKARARQNAYETWPRVAVIAPAAGSDPGLAECLSSLLSQDYPDYQIIVVTGSPEDPATATAERAVRDHIRAKAVCSGRAVNCGQKNHNLLTGVSRIDDDREVLVFCDTTRLAHPSFLQDLVRPLARGEALVSSGYFHVIPRTPKLAVLCHTFTSLVLFVTRGIPWLMQPWGGGTAIRRSTFEALHVDRLWAENVVDDVSLGAYLQKARVGVVSTPEACPTVPLADQTLRAWSDWLTRQLLYAKYCYPVGFTVLGIYLYSLSGLILWSVVQLLSVPLGWTDIYSAGLASVFLSLLLFLLFSFRSFHPCPGPWPAWLAATFTAAFLGGPIHLRTVFTQKIRWRGISYRVTWSGRVTDIRYADPSR
jgi:cellulose synthase/poly-beta-1,6-N-acetylglucosamine synthase-like glycosyltransferase